VSTAGGSNYAHSVFQRLLNYAKAKNKDFNLLLIRYGLERLLYRLSISPHAHRFILKGANLFLAWTGHSHRATKDADLLAIGPAELPSLSEVLSHLPEFLLPPLRAASGQAEPPGHWSPGGPWSSVPPATGDT